MQRLMKEKTSQSNLKQKPGDKSHFLAMVEFYTKLEYGKIIWIGLRDEMIKL